MSLDLSPVAAQDAPDTSAESTSGFATLGLASELARSVADAGYSDPTDVQARAIPAALTGVDLLVSSRTGSGKTAAFVLPALQRVLEARRDPARKRERGQPNGPRALVLAPTRELALQVSKACQVYGRHLQGLRIASIVGGVPYGAQLKALRGPLDILIATPGRLLDHLGTGKAVLGQVEMLVLDEADRMLDMGFIDDIHAIAAEMSPKRQTLMFSATFEGHVGELAQQLTHEAQRIRVSAPTEAHTQIEQRLHWADDRAHRDALLEHLLVDRDIDQAVVFTSTQRDADQLADRLQQMGHHAAALHGAMPQGRRNRVLGALRTRQLRILVATDVAARGIDVPTISHVINYGLPMKAEDYVHRIGRTGRAGRSGVAVTIAERRDVGMIRRIERFTTHAIPPSVVPGLEPRLAPPAPSRPKSAGGPRGDRGRSRDGYGARPGFGGHHVRGDRPFGDRPHGDRPHGERPHGDRPFGDRPHGDRSFGDRAHGAGPRRPAPAGAHPGGFRHDDRPSFPHAHKAAHAGERGDARREGFAHGPRREGPGARHDAPGGWRDAGPADPRGARPARPHGDAPQSRPAREFGDARPGAPRARPRSPR